MSTRRSSPVTTALLAFTCTFAFGACCRPCSPPVCRPTTIAVPSKAAPTAEERIAAGWRVRARAAEPAVTRMLQEIAEAEGGTLAGLEHRLKSLPSTVSKLRRLRAEAPETPLEDVVLYDALRYTLIVADDPPGHHDAMIRRTLSALESAGHDVERVKNYWPRGDSYSGTNCVIVTPGDLTWELQFHTPGSYATKESTHADYDRMRDDGTPLDDRRRLFQKMSEAWDSVPIPNGILVPGSLHAVEEVRLLPAP